MFSDPFIMRPRVWLWAGILAVALPVAASEDDLMLFALRLGEVEIAPSLPAFTKGDGYLVPLGEFCQDLDLAIQVDPAAGKATGFLITENRPFRLDARTGELTVGGRTQTLDRNLLELRPDDIYLDTRLLGLCLPLEVLVMPRSSMITLKAKETLPIQSRWAREGRGGAIRGAAPGETFEPAEDPYRLLEFPSVDVTLGVQKNAGRRETTQATVAGAGDLLWMTTSVYGQMNNPAGGGQFRMTVGRKDPHAGLLGPLQATEFGVGEVLDPGLNLMANPWSGTGFLLTNRPPQFGGAFDQHSFQGQLLPGWQVELYQNSILVGFQASRADGQYQFLNVPLYFGLNDFRLAFYGPQGQRREELVRLDVSQNQTPAGTLYYHLVGLEPHAGVGRRGQFQVGYGLSEQLTATFATAQATLGKVEHTYTQVGLQGYWKPLSASFTAGHDAQGGTVVEMALRKGLGPLSLVGKEIRLLDGFTSEVFQSPLGAIWRRRDVEVSAALPSRLKNLFSVDLQAYRDDGAAGGAADTLNARLSTSLRGTYLSNQLTRTRVRTGKGPDYGTSFGSFLASKVYRSFALRGQAMYNLQGARTLQSLGVTADLFSFAPLSVQTGFSRTISNRENVVNLGVVKGQGAFSFGANVAYSNRTRLTANLTLRMGFAVDPGGGKVLTTGVGAVGNGALSAQAFVDLNGNGRRDPGERPLPDVALTVNGSRQPSVTDAQGRVFLGGLPQQVDAQVAIAPASLEDPLMRGERPGVQVTPRNGHVTRLDLPVVLFSEISGTAYRNVAGEKKELAGLRLDLLDAGGKVVKSLRTGYDGFYEFTNLPPGSYLMRVPETSAKALGVEPPAPRPLLLAPEGSMLEGVDFVLAAPSPGPLP